MDLAAMPEIRADMVTVFVFRRAGGAVEFLQMRRAREPYQGTWQPIMGGIASGESGVDAAIRELGEETGLDASSGKCLGLWCLDQVFPFYMPAQDVIMLSPTFVAEAAPGWSPSLNEEHDACRWSPAGSIDGGFLWAGHAASCREIVECVLRPGSACEPLLRVARGPPPRPGGGAA